MLRQKDKVVKTVDVYETTDYDKFTLVKGNRKPDKGHTQGLKLSMIEHGNLTVDDPIEVNEKFQVFDGQHRLAALKKLGLPVYYIFRDKPTIQDIRIANSNRRNWNWHDFATSYRDELANVNYAQFLKLREEFGYGFRILLTYSGADEPNLTPNKTAPRNNKGTNVQRFLAGDFVMKDYDKTRELLGMYQEVAEAAKLNNREFAIAFYRFAQTSTYNHAKMLEKVRAHKTALAGCYLTTDFLYTLQDIWRA